MERTDPSEAWRAARRCDSRDGNLLHSPAQSHFQRIRMLLSGGLRSREIDSPRLRHRASVDEIQPLLFYGSLEESTRRRREQRAPCREESGAAANVESLHRASALCG